MGRHEIRFRRKRMTSRRIQSHKNYMMVMEKHRKTNRWRRLIRSLVYILILLGMILLIYFGIQTLNQDSQEEKESFLIEDISRPGSLSIVEHKSKHHEES
jgi:TRAP-type C4-dicarboxylate transport system permease small subunit